MARPGDNRDYLDKALDAVEKQVGKRTGRHIDPNRMRSTNEKITDKIRQVIEKMTGRKVPAKFSN